jgi:hypothetical protein
MLVVNAAFSIFALISVPLWSVFAALIVFFFSIFIYDVDAGSNRVWFPLPRLIVDDIFIRGTLFVFPLVSIVSNTAHKGIGQIFLSIFSSLGASVLGVLGCVGSFLRWCGRRTWDTLMYALIIRTKARVPATNGFLTRRIAGPGLGVEYFQVIGAPTALVMIQYQLELLQVQLYRLAQQHHIGRPTRVLARYYDGFRDVGLASQPFAESKMAQFLKTKVIIESVDDYRVYLHNLLKMQRILEEHLDKSIKVHMQSLAITNNFNNTRIRLARADLDHAIIVGQMLVRDFVKNVLEAEYPSHQKRFWLDKGLVENDFGGLCEWTLVQGFTPSILQPIEETHGLRIIVEVREK